jgi:hypothetical protein
MLTATAPLEERRGQLGTINRNGKFWMDFSGVLGDFPAIHFAFQMSVTSAR